MKTILILDDERVLREAFAAYFEDRLWRPIQAKSAEEALTLLEDESPAAALVDHRLPGIDGDGFVRKACLLKPRMAFIICTGSPDYVIPPDLRERSQVSNHPFRKPMTSMADLEKTFIQIIEYLSEARDEE